MNKHVLLAIAMLTISLIIAPTVLRAQISVSIDSPDPQTIVPEWQEQDISCSVSGGNPDGDCFTYTWTDTSGDDLTDYDEYNGSSTATTSDTLYYTPNENDLDTAEDVEVDVTDSEGDEDFDDVEIDVPAIKDSSPGTVYSDDGDNTVQGNSSVITGEMMHLTVDVPNQSATSYSWTIAGDCYSSWDSEAASATLNPLPDSTLSTQDYFYADANTSDATTSCTVTTDNGSGQVFADFTIVMPSISALNLQGASQHTPAITQTPPALLEYGANGTVADQGIAFTFNTTNVAPSGFSGTFCNVQVASDVENSGTTYSSLFPSTNSQQNVADYAPAGSGTLPGDAPGEPLQVYTLGFILHDRWATLHMFEVFDTWVMFQPTGVGDDAQWVPLAYVDWDWTADATYDTSTSPIPYDLSNASASTPTTYDGTNYYPSYSGTVDRSW